MKKYVLASAFAGLSMIAAVPAHADDGFIGATFGRIDVGVGDADSWGIHGATNFNAGSGMRFLIDGSFTDSNDVDVQSLVGTGHLVWDSGGNSAFGVFLGLANVDSGGGDSQTIAGGGEYAMFMNGGTLALSAGIGTNDDADTDLFGGAIEYRLFASDNTRVDFNGALFRFDTSLGDADGTSLGIGIEHLLGGGFSIGGGYNRVDVDDAGIEADIFMITGRFNFGGKTLRDRDRTGNTFGPLGGFAGALTLF
jgi:hypothetical protein